MVNKKTYTKEKFYISGDGHYIPLGNEEVKVPEKCWKCNWDYEKDCNSLGCRKKRNNEGG